MLREVFSEGYQSKCAFTYETNAQVADGVLVFSKQGGQDAK